MEYLQQRLSFRFADGLFKPRIILKPSAYFSVVHVDSKTTIIIAAIIDDNWRIGSVGVTRSVRGIRRAILAIVIPNAFEGIATSVLTVLIENRINSVL